jgi:carbon starvation protein
MNILVLFIAGVAIFALASRFYARVISNNFGVDPASPTPAVTNNDGRDFVPTRIHVLFAHHFSAIAGAGPILGPTIAILYGYTPVWLWIVLGCVFFGAVHDFTAIFVSVREGGRSMAEVSRTTLGRASFVMFILFTIVMLVLVTSNFLAATAVSLTSMWPIDKLGLSAGQSFLKAMTAADGRTLGVIGGIASTSVVIITLLSPLLGYLIYRRKMNTAAAYALASLICIGSVVAGIYAPISLDPKVWMVVLSVYVMFAAVLPVWFILQPRDFINVQILYAGLFLLAAGVIIGGLQGARMQIPAENITQGTARLGMIWPLLFITVACGAISGFHALVAGGTTAKQIATEAHAKRIGYDGMLLEGVLALLVMLALGSSLAFDDYLALVWPTAEQVKLSPSNPILAFSLAVGHLLDGTLHIPQALATVFGILLVEGFVITTLDAAVRLNRYLFEELWRIAFGAEERVPGVMRHAWFNSGLSVVLMAVLAFTNSFHALWPLFGTSNQLLAALTLFVVSAWLILHGKRAVYTLLPAVFILVTTCASLWLLTKKYFLAGNMLLTGAAIILAILTLSMVAFTIVKLPKVLSSRSGAKAE